VGGATADTAGGPRGGGVTPFGALLRRYRQAAGLTQEELAERAGVSARAVSALERGVNRAPRPATLDLLAEALGVAPEARATLEVARRGGRGGVAVARRHNLPAQLTSFVGREREVAAVRERLLDSGVRLLTLTGPGGVGKTRLALRAAAGLLERFGDGVCFVSLAPLADPALVPSAIAQALGLQEGGGRPLLPSLQAFLRDKRLLLVLDNCEHVADAAAAEAWRAGQALSLPEAVAVVLSTADPPPPVVQGQDRATHPRPGPAPTMGLTSREQEVAALIARGLSNRQIGEALFITPGTAATHVAHILAKLNVTSRAQIAAWAATQGLLESRPRAAVADW